MKIHIMSLISDQVAGSVFSISALLCDGYGNVVMDNVRKVNLSIQMIDQDEVTQDWPLAEQLSQQGSVVFSGLMFNKTRTTCRMSVCTRAWSRVMLSSNFCVVSRPCGILSSVSNNFFFDAAKATTLILLSQPSKLLIASSIQYIQLQVRDDFGNVVTSKNRCSKVCVTGVGQPPLSQNPTVHNSNNSCLESVNGQAEFHLSLDSAAKNTSLLFYCISSTAPSTPFAKLVVTGLEVVVLQKFIVTSQPSSTIAGNVLVPQPVVQLCGTDCIKSSECCIFNSSGVVIVDQDAVANGLIGRLSAPIIEGIGAFTDLQVPTILTQLD